MVILVGGQFLLGEVPLSHTWSKSKKDASYFSMRRQASTPYTLHPTPDTPHLSPHTLQYAPCSVCYEGTFEQMCYRGTWCVTGVPGQSQRRTPRTSPCGGRRALGCCSRSPCRPLPKPTNQIHYPERQTGPTPPRSSLLNARTGSWAGPPRVKRDPRVGTKCSARLL